MGYKKIIETVSIKTSMKKNHITIETDEYMLIFGEQVPLNELASTAKKRTAELKQILYDYAKPILDEYSQKL